MKTVIKKKAVRLAAAAVLLLAPILLGCGADDQALKDVIASLAQEPDYSVVLNDMKEEGNFFKSYYHQYRVIQPDLAWNKGWMEVSEDMFRKYEGFLGMALAAKVAGKMTEAIAPPLYAFVGDSRYGSWRTDATGREFWGFNPGGGLIDEFEVDLHLPIYRSHYKKYSSHRSKKMPYYGPNNAYGTNGSLTQKAKPNFFKRRMAKAGAQKTSFSQKVSKRIGRTKTSFQGRSGSKGK